jgi:hypothetical protein
MMKKEPFENSNMKDLKPHVSAMTFDVISLQDENPSIIVGPQIEDGSNAFPPFYVSLNVHDKILHNCLMESGASHNVMPKVVMEELGLEITKPYQYPTSLTKMNINGASKGKIGPIGIGGAFKDSIGKIKIFYSKFTCIDKNNLVEL